MKRPRLALAGFLLLVCASPIAAPGCRRATDEPAGAAARHEPLSVTASFYPLAEFARRVGDDHVEVKNVTPAGAEPHDFEPTPLDVAAVYRSRLFLYNGNGLDPWADKLADDLRAKGVTAVDVSARREVRSVVEKHAESTRSDPHVWLDPTIAAREVAVIAEELSRIDPAHAGDYGANRDRTIERLTRLDEEYRRGLADCRRRVIVTAHDAFRFLAARYHLETRSILGFAPDEEPSPQRIAEVVNLAKKEHIDYVFVEKLVSPKVAETVAKEIGGRTLVLDPLEGLTEHELRAGKDYVSVMEDNLASLRTALSCR